jgi:hypothetical protein
VYTAEQVVQAIKDYGLVIVEHREGNQWRVVGRDGGRLSPFLPTPEEAVEIAVARLTEGRTRSLEADAARLFDRLRQGTYFARPRDVQVTDPTTGQPITVKRWDVFLATDNTRIVTGERSLAVAIIEAEKWLAQQGGGQ